MATMSPEVAREYLRVSQDKAGKLESPEEQHDENAEHAARNGWLLGDPYAEAEAVSASRYAAKERDEFARLLADLRSGRFAAGVLILWESSRGSRQVGEWVALIEACETAAVGIYVTTHGRRYDPANARDRRSLLEDAIDSEYDSAKTRTRVIRSMTARARNGEPHGPVRYGYARVYDAANRRLFTEHLQPGEAENIAELFRRLHAGDTLKAIERDWAGRGIVTRGTKRVPPHPFTHQDLRAMGLNPAYAGLRVRQPKGTVRRLDFIDGAVPAKWPAIVDTVLFHSVRDILTSPARMTSRPGRGKHLLSLIAGCGECPGLLSVWYRHGVRCYACRDRGCVMVSADDLDSVAVPIVHGWLSGPGTAETLRPSEGGFPELGAVRAEIVEAAAALADWRRRAGLRKVTAESFEAVEPVILAEIGRLEERERALSVPSELEGWAGPPEAVMERWNNSEMAGRRMIARAVLSPRRVGVLRVARVGARGKWSPSVPAAERIRLDREQGARSARDRDFPAC